jgi:L-seryl-tRNA(Ser) seleniumtransferase
MTDIAKPASLSRTTIYDEIGIKTVINGRGATTAVGGSQMHPETLAAMAEATKAFVVLEELNAKVGEKIAAITGAEAGYVTCGSAAAMAIAAAACIAGTDREKIRRLPHSEGMKNEVIIHRAHRINYDQMYLVGGGRLVEIGLPYETQPWELEKAITGNTAAIAYHDSPNCSPGAIPFGTVIEIAKVRGVPVIVDSASTLPPIDHLRRWTRWGADLVIYSGGKGIRGPQDSGMLAGRRDLIEAARLNGNPHAAIGRGMKVSKEAMVGLWKAIDLFLATDHEAELAVHKGQAAAIEIGLKERDDIRVTIEEDWEDWPAPVVRIFPVNAGWDPSAVHRALQNDVIPIQINCERGGLMINTHWLQDGEPEIIVERLHHFFDLFGTAK